MAKKKTGEAPTRSPQEVEQTLLLLTFRRRHIFYAYRTSAYHTLLALEELLSAIRETEQTDATALTGMVKGYKTILQSMKTASRSLPTKERERIQKEVRARLQEVRESVSNDLHPSKRTPENLIAGYQAYVLKIYEVRAYLTHLLGLELVLALLSIAEIEPQYRDEGDIAHLAMVYTDLKVSTGKLKQEVKASVHSHLQDLLGEIEELARVEMERFERMPMQGTLF